MIRIAFIIDTVGPQPGGTEGQLLLLVRHLDRTRFAPYLLFLETPDAAVELPGKTQVRTFPAASFKSAITYRSIFRLAAFLRRERVEIVQTHFRNGNLIGTAGAWLAGVPHIISTRRGLAYGETASDRALLRLLRARTTLFLANTASLAAQVCREEGVAEARVRVIHNGCEPHAEPGRPLVDPRALRAGLGLREQGPVVVAVSNLRPVKRIDLFVDACARVCARHPSAQFLSVGDGPLGAALRERARALGMASRMIFAGHRADARELLPLCSLGVLCSDSEGLSNAILEYMAAGLPVVCTDVGGNRDLVEDHVSGLLTPPGQAEPLASAIHRLLEDEGLRTRMGHAAARAVAERFSVEAMVRRTQELYEELAGRRPGRRRDDRGGRSGAPGGTTGS